MNRMHVYHKKLAHIIIESGNRKPAVWTRPKIQERHWAGLVLRPLAWRLGRVDGAKTGRQTPRKAGGAGGI